MTLLDANVLIAAWNVGDPKHSKAKEWVEELLSGSEWVAIPWVTVWAFLRVTTNPRLFLQPLAPEAAFRIVEGWVALPNVVMVQPGSRHQELLKDLVTRGQASGPLVSDAVLAALAIEQGATLASSDRDFRRFLGLRWFDPLAS